MPHLFVPGELGRKWRRDQVRERETKEEKRDKRTVSVPITDNHLQVTVLGVK
jgi:hypothetical protein